MKIDHSTEMKNIQFDIKKLDFGDFPNIENSVWTPRGYEDIFQKGCEVLHHKPIVMEYVAVLTLKNMKVNMEYDYEDCLMGEDGEPVLGYMIKSFIEYHEQGEGEVIFIFKTVFVTSTGDIKILHALVEITCSLEVGEIRSRCFDSTSNDLSHLELEDVLYKLLFDIEDEMDKQGGDEIA